MTDATSFHKYSSIDQFAKVASYLEPHTVLVQEKVDGTNVSMHFHDGVCELWGRNIPIDRAKPGMYKPFVEWFAAREQDLLERFENIAWPRNTIFYGELINTNKLRYKEAPPIILFDYTCYLANGSENFVKDAYDFAYDLNSWGHFFGVPITPTLYVGYCNVMPALDTLIAPSFFDEKVTMEGVVVKGFNVDIPYIDEEGFQKLSHKLRLYGKYVRPEFKEVTTKPIIKGEPIGSFAENYATEARLDKAIQKARESSLDFEKNRGILIKIAIEDIMAEEGDAFNQHILNVFGTMVRKSIGTRLMSIYNEKSNDVR